jgi:putative cardiolipin synthase
MYILQRIKIIVLLIAITTGCTSLPKEIEHPVEPITTVQNSALSALEKTFMHKQPNEGNSAVLLQKTGWDALAQRLALIETAEHTVDIQYYIWNSDITGHYLASRLIAAADRGVKVRVLLDDINLNERESLLTTIDAHPQIEIRIFNPIPSRRGVAKWFNLLGDLSRLNRRMHNKSFTVDGVFSVVGGRNIGDEYFDFSDDINFRDRDALVTGEVINDIQKSFTEYWDSRWSYPVGLLGGKSNSKAALLEQATPPQYKFQPALPEGNQPAYHFLQKTIKKMTFVDASFVYDKPVPLDVNNTNTPKATALLIEKLSRQAQHEVLLESAYLIFDERQLNDWRKLTLNGVVVKALTNSMASNDLVTNHSGYAGRRKEMLQQGIQLFELKPETPLCIQSTKDLSKCAPETAYGLHAKSIVFDRKLAVIGSFNFNLRSTYLNTESLLIIENDSIAQNLSDDMKVAMSDENSWSLNLHKGQINWHSGNKMWESEPETHLSERIISSFLQLLPIEKYL